MPTGSIAFLIFTGVITFAVLLQTIILVALLVAAKAFQRKVMDQVDKLHSELTPLLQASTRVVALIEEVTPRIQSITKDVQVAGERLRGQIDHIDSLVTEITGRTRHQVVRVDNMVSSTLDTVARGTRTIQDNVMAPLRQVGGWMNAIGGAMDVMLRGDRRPRRPSRGSF